MWLICLLSYLGLDDLSLAPIYRASFYKVHAFADVTVLEIGVKLEGGGVEVWIFCGKTQWPITWVIYCEICTDQKQGTAAHPNHAHKIIISNLNMIYHNKSLQMWLVQLGNFCLPYVFAKFIKVVTQILLKNVLTDCAKSMLLSQN